MYEPTFDLIPLSLFWSKSWNVMFTLNQILQAHDTRNKIMKMVHDHIYELATRRTKALRGRAERVERLR